MPGRGVQLVVQLGVANLHYALFEGSPTVSFPEGEVTEFTEGCQRGEKKFFFWKAWN